MFFVVFICNIKLNMFVRYNNDHFKELPFYNTYIEIPKIKPIESIDLFSELPFYKGLNVVKLDHTFK